MHKVKIQKGQIQQIRLLYIEVVEEKAKDVNKPIECTKEKEAQPIIFVLCTSFFCILNTSTTGGSLF